MYNYELEETGGGDSLAKNLGTVGAFTKNSTTKETPWQHTPKQTTYTFDTTDDAPIRYATHIRKIENAKKNKFRQKKALL